MKIKSILVLIIGAISAKLVHAQAPAQAPVPVPVGKGSYASFPPPGIHVDNKTGEDMVAKADGRPLYLVKKDDRAVPSNKWYNNVIYNQYGTGLWPMPHRVSATKTGIEITFPEKSAGDHFATDAPLIISGKNFNPVDSRCKNWTDWTVTFRSYESDSKYMDVTLGEGMPFVWSEINGFDPILAVDPSNPEVKLFDVNGAGVKLPYIGDMLGIIYKGHRYGVFAPDNTKFDLGDKAINVTFAGKGSYLVTAMLPSEKDAAMFQKYAFAVPRDTKLSWNYDNKAGTITTKWNITAEALKGDNKAVIQGFLPHQWRENIAKTDFSGPSYPTIRGMLKCGFGNEFTIAFPFNGIVPNYPAPNVAGFDPERVKAILAKGNDWGKSLGGDTYWGGKELEYHAQAAFMAKQINDPQYAAIVKKLRGGLENWLTYTPGETKGFFAKYQHRKGLVGLPVSYGSQDYNDVHFHYGYFTYTAGILGQLQPDFLEGYGDMMRLIAKAYANWDRKDNNFPFLRTFDIWRGHSFADGDGFPDGNNQESTGEAINSWAGLILLGQALGDKDMLAAGIMGYSFESRANMEYWFDEYQDVFPKTYGHKVAGMIWTTSYVYGTWFSGDPSWIFGIQWIPSGPHAAFYGRNQDFVKNTYEEFKKEFKITEDKNLAERDAFIKKRAERTPEQIAKDAEKEAAMKPDERQRLADRQKPYVKKTTDIKDRDPELAAIHFGFLMNGDPAFVCDQLDRLWAEPNDKIAHGRWMANVYYEASFLKQSGLVDWTCHGSSPTSMIYVKDGKRTFVAWNPTAKAQTVEFFEGDKPLGKLVVKPNDIAGSTQLAR